MWTSNFGLDNDSADKESKFNLNALLASYKSYPRSLKLFIVISLLEGDYIYFII